MNGTTRMSARPRQPRSARRRSLASRRLGHIGHHRRDLAIRRHPRQRSAQAQEEPDAEEAVGYHGDGIGKAIGEKGQEAGAEANAGRTNGLVFAAGVADDEATDQPQKHCNDVHGAGNAEVQAELQQEIVGVGEIGIRRAEKRGIERPQNRPEPGRVRTCQCEQLPTQFGTSLNRCKFEYLIDQWQNVGQFGILPASTADRGMERCRLLVSGVEQLLVQLFPRTDAGIGDGDVPPGAEPAHADYLPGQVVE